MTAVAAECEVGVRRPAATVCREGGGGSVRGRWAADVG